jgi:dephospho-CoA kinase
VLLVGLTGGIGAGKSTVASMLERHGAVVIDADELARRAVEPGTHGYAEVLRRFGPEVVALSGELDREQLASMVFADPVARADLEAITHPEVARLFQEQVEPYRETDRIVVFVVPLLVEAGMQDWFDAIVTVSASLEVRIARLSRDRGMSGESARNRIAAQIGDAERERVAAFVIRNDRTIEELEAEVGAVWAELRRLASSGN